MKTAFCVPFGYKTGANAKTFEETNRVSEEVFAYTFWEADNVYEHPRKNTSTQIPCHNDINEPVAKAI
jgi:hypothetical protein